MKTTLPIAVILILAISYGPHLLSGSIEKEVVTSAENNQYTSDVVQEATLPEKSVAIGKLKTGEKVLEQPYVIQADYASFRSTLLKTKPISFLKKERHEVSLPFTFKYFTKHYNSISISRKGYIVFDTDSYSAVNAFKTELSYPLSTGSFGVRYALKKDSVEIQWYGLKKLKSFSPVIITLVLHQNGSIEIKHEVKPEVLDTFSDHVHFSLIDTNGVELSIAESFRPFAIYQINPST